MTDLVEVDRGMFQGRVVAAPDMPAFLADTQVHPIVPSEGKAVDTTGSRWRHILDLVKMPADFAHVDLLEPWAVEDGVGSANSVNSLLHAIRFAIPSYDDVRNS